MGEQYGSSATDPGSGFLGWLEKSGARYPFRPDSLGTLPLYFHQALLVPIEDRRYQRAVAPHPTAIRAASRALPATDPMPYRRCRQVRVRRLVIYLDRWNPPRRRRRTRFAGWPGLRLAENVEPAVRVQGGLGVDTIVARCGLSRDAMVTEPRVLRLLPLSVAVAGLDSLRNECDMPRIRKINAAGLDIRARMAG